MPVWFLLLSLYFFLSGSWFFSFNCEVWGFTLQLLWGIQSLLIFWNPSSAWQHLSFFFLSLVFWVNAGWMLDLCIPISISLNSSLIFITSPSLHLLFLHMIKECRNFVVVLIINVCSFKSIVLSGPSAEFCFCFLRWGSFWFPKTVLSFV